MGDRRFKLHDVTYIPLTQCNPSKFFLKILKQPSWHKGEKPEFISDITFCICTLHQVSHCWRNVQFLHPIVGSKSLGEKGESNHSGSFSSLTPTSFSSNLLNLAKAQSISHNPLAHLTSTAKGGYFLDFINLYISICHLLKRSPGNVPEKVSRKF